MGEQRRAFLSDKKESYSRLSTPQQNGRVTGQSGARRGARKKYNEWLYICELREDCIEGL